MKLLKILSLSLIYLLTSCTSDDLVQQEKNIETKMDPSFSRMNINSDFVTNEKNLNIIYFVPNDNPEVEGYQERLSELLIYFQTWMKNEMNRNGYGDKTFGLPLNALTGKVNIITIKGNEGQAAYDYGSSSKILAEINQYKTQHSSEFSSNYHNLIILPQRKDGGRQPFYGFTDGALKGICFAVDNPNIKVSEIATTTSSYIGGMLHELGHGLGLPHNSEKVSEKNVLGTALMGGGNGTFGRKPTFLTTGSAAILDKNEIFQSQVIPGISYYDKGSYTINAKLSYDPILKKIIVNGNFTSSIPVSKALLWLDPNTENAVGVNKDYNSIVWPVNVNGNTIYGEIPVDELFVKGSTMYEYKIRLLQNNGVLLESILYFNFLNNQVIDPAKSVLFFQSCNYNGSGYWKSLAEGAYTTQDLINAGIKDNDISSIRPASGYKVSLYDGNNFSGELFTVTNNTSCQFNDRTSSLKIEKIIN